MGNAAKYAVDYRALVPSLEEIERRLANYEPKLVRGAGRPRAAVALILREAASRLELLFIERAQCEGDPWSGQMAFPGGHVDPSDPNPRAAAEREVSEEVAVSLHSARYLGRLDDLEGHSAGGLVISAHVYHLPESGPLIPNSEVETAFWFPVEQLLDPRRQVDHGYAATEALAFPGVVVGEPGRHVVWGLTYRFLDHFLVVVGHPLPDRWRRARA